MQYKAVIFDLFETLITEWGHEKYTKSQMSEDLGIEKSAFDLYWDQQENNRYIGLKSFTDSILYVCEKCGKTADSSLITDILNKRMRTKAACFEYVNPDVYRLLDKLRLMGMHMAVISNCSGEETAAVRQSKLYRYFEQIILSCEVKMKKPDRCIYIKTADLLGIAPSECIFVGDGGSSELEGAEASGMKAVQAKWYTNQLPYKRDSSEGFTVAEKPLDILKYIE